MSKTANCLNCNSPVSGKFCSECGQKTDTHRITFKHFIFHDILHGIWHFEKGILFTLKEAVTRPGKAALDYISGKRIRYYNVFYLILLLIGLNIFIIDYYDTLSHIYFNTSLEPQTDRIGKSLNAFLEHYVKLNIFSFVPLFAINSSLLFRKKKLNFSENFIIAGMIFLGVMVIVTVSSILGFLDFFKHMDFIGEFINVATPASILIFVAAHYFLTFKNEYSIAKIVIKSSLFIFLLLIELIIMLLLLIGYFSHWTYSLKLIY